MGFSYFFSIGVFIDILKESFQSYECRYGTIRCGQVVRSAKKRCHYDRLLTMDAYALNCF